jgi:hypothetical protein
MELLASLPVENGRWGETATDFQRRDAAAVLDSNGPPFTFVTRPRGGRKSTDAAALCVALHMTIAPAGATSFVVAADSEQAGIVLDSVRSFLRGARALRKFIKVEARRVVFLADGEPTSSIAVLPADEASSYGLRPYLVIADELSVWPDSANAKGLWSAVVSAMPKIKGSKLVVVTSAGAPDHWSATVLEHARTSAQWQVLETPGPLPWISSEVLAEQRSLLTGSAYARLHENRWVAGEDRLTTPEQVRACVGHTGRLTPQRGVRYTLGLDVGLVNDKTCLTIAHRERRDDAEVVVVDHQEVWQGTKDRPVDLGVVEEYCREAVRQYPGRMVFDPWQSVHLAQRLRARGISVEEFTFSSASVGHLAVTLYRLLRDRLLDLPDDDELTSELSSVVLRENAPGVYRIDTTGHGHDDRVISLALVAQHLASQGSGTLRLQVPEGRLLSARIDRRGNIPRGEPAIAVVRPGEPRPADRLVQFRYAKRHPNYLAPGSMKFPDT